MPSPLAHSVSGYVLAKFLPLDKISSDIGNKWHVHILYPILVAVAADLDFIPQIITGVRFHRGLTHSLTFTLICSAIIGLLLSYLWKFSYKQLFLFTLLLYSSHLCLDFFTNGGQGMQLFFPFTTSYFKSPVAIFPAIHHSRGLWDYSHLLPLVFESTYSVLLLSVVAWYQGRRQSQ
ncbi:MAG: metal-dependent hydrolase [Symploca sp. SIO2E6]|nr:metal-dependent hydrolase [Symploca sp. SIO2E6]